MISMKRASKVTSGDWVAPTRHKFELNGDKYEYRYGKYFKLLRTNS